jgi:RNA polymerase-binding transcription factor DksA
MEGVDARRRLEQEREEAKARLAALTGDYAGVVAAARDANSDDEHDPEGATIAYEREQIGALVQQAERNLAEIDAALERLGTGTYGVCESCGEKIAEGRLEARPVARTSITCASAQR